MIGFRHRTTGAVVLAITVDGFGAEDWEQLGELPEGLRPDLARWDGQAFVPDLETARLVAWQRIKAAREAAINGGADTPHGRFDSDEKSRANISGAVIGAQLAMASEVPFAINWTLADNSDVSLDAPKMVAVGLAVLMHVDACHAVARGLRTALEAASSIDAINAIGWPAAGGGDA